MIHLVNDKLQCSARSCNTGHFQHVMLGHKCIFNEYCKCTLNLSKIIGDRISLLEQTSWYSHR